MTDLYDMSTKYYLAKRDLVTLSLTRKASGAVLTHLAKQHPDQMNLRHAEPIPSFILKEHRTEGKIIPASAAGNLVTSVVKDQEKSPALVDLLLKAQEKPQMTTKGSAEKFKNELQALPDIFPISILQASRSDYIRDVEAVLTSYVHEQYSRYKFAATGALRRNDYEFLPARRVRATIVDRWMIGYKFVHRLLAAVSRVDFAKSEEKTEEYFCACVLTILL